MQAFQVASQIRNSIWKRHCYRFYHCNIYKTVASRFNRSQFFSDSNQTSFIAQRTNKRASGVYYLTDHRAFSRYTKHFYSAMAEHSLRVPFEIEQIPLLGLNQASQLNLSVVNNHPTETGVDALVVGVRKLPFSEVSVSEQNLTACPQQTNFLENLYDSVSTTLITDAITRLNFSGAEGKTISVRSREAGSPYGDVSCLGLGSTGSNGCEFAHTRNVDTTELTPYTCGKLGKSLASLLSNLKAMTAILSLQASDISPEGLEALIESFLVSLSVDTRFKGKSNNTGDLSIGSEKLGSRVESLTISIIGTVDFHKYSEALVNAKKSAPGIQLARELVSAPSNFCTTENLAKTAVKIAQQHDLEYTILGEKECIERKMGAYLAVHQGSLYAPQFIHLKYTPKNGSPKKKVALIGKGICMDTGGYNLKVGAGIETMKIDMAGAAAVLGAAMIIGEMKPENVEIHFIVPAAENMISARAYRPGDIITASNGMTIEVGNTDAEGRLILADALAYTEMEIKPDFILDCATLTGAILIALGSNVGGLYGTNDQWTNIILNSAKKSGSPVWPMPLVTDYRQHLDSKLADINNLASVRNAGSITAALFLKEFVKDKTPWCHLDMTGPVYDSNAKEGTGYGAKLLALSATASSLV